MLSEGLMKVWSWFGCYAQKLFHKRRSIPEDNSEQNTVKMLVGPSLGLWINATKHLRYAENSWRMQLLLQLRYLE